MWQWLEIDLMAMGGEGVASVPQAEAKGSGKASKEKGTAPNNRELSVLGVDEDTLTKISHCYVYSKSLIMQSTEGDVLILTALH